MVAHCKICGYIETKKTKTKSKTVQKWHCTSQRILLCIKYSRINRWQRIKESLLGKEHYITIFCLSNFSLQKPSHSWWTRLDQGFSVHWCGLYSAYVSGMYIIIKKDRYFIQCFRSVIRTETWTIPKPRWPKDLLSSSADQLLNASHLSMLQGSRVLLLPA